MSTSEFAYTRIPRPRAILFDHDGVLVNSEPIHWSAWEALLNELKIPYHREEISTLVGKTAPEILARILDKHRPGWRSEQYDVHALALRKNDFYLDLARAELKLYPGVREGLEWCRSEGIKTAVVSNAKRRELEAAHRLLGTDSLVDALISRDDANASKPDPAPYLLGAAELGVDKGDCMAVEDSPPGIESALISRIPATAVLTHFSHEVMSAPVPGRPDLKPVWIVRSMLEFFERLRASR